MFCLIEVSKLTLFLPYVFIRALHSLCLSVWLLSLPMEMRRWVNPLLIDIAVSGKARQGHLDQFAAHTHCCVSGDQTRGTWVNLLLTHIVVLMKSRPGGTWVSPLFIPPPSSLPSPGWWVNPLLIPWIRPCIVEAVTRAQWVNLPLIHFLLPCFATQSWWVNPLLIHIGTDAVSKAPDRWVNSLLIPILPCLTQPFSALFISPIPALRQIFSAHTPEQWWAHPLLITRK